MVLKEKKYLFFVAGIIVLFGTIAVINFFKEKNPFNIIEETINIKMPASAKVEQYTYYDDGGYYDIKIRLAEDYMSDLQDQLNHIFHQSIPKQDYENPNYFKGTCSWWDLDYKNVVIAYNGFCDSVKKWYKATPDSHEVWVFISKQDDGNYYLYISY